MSAEAFLQIRHLVKDFDGHPAVLCLADNLEVGDLI